MAWGMVPEHPATHVPAPQVTTKQPATRGLFYCYARGERPANSGVTVQSSIGQKYNTQAALTDARITTQQHKQGNEMMLMVLVLTNTRIAHMMGESLVPVEGFVIPLMMDGAKPIVCKSLEDNAPFSMIEYR